MTSHCCTMYLAIIKLLANRKQNKHQKGIYTELLFNFEQNGPLQLFQNVQFLFCLKKKN